MSRTVVLYYDNGKFLFTDLNSNNEILEADYTVDSAVKAIKKLGSIDKTILTISAEDTTLSLITTSPIRRHDLDTVLNRKAELAWNRDGEYRLAYSNLGKSKNGKLEYLLQLVPLNIIDTYIDINQRLSTEPIGAFSTSALSYVGSKLDGNSAEITVLSNRKGVEVHVDSTDGNLYIRKIKNFLDEQNNYEVDHLISEIRRTELYAKQQFSKIITGITIYGIDIDIISDRLKKTSGITPIYGGVVVDWHLKAISSHIKREQSSNLLPHKFITQKQYSRNMIISVIGSIILLLISIIAYILVNRNITISEINNPIESIIQETSKVQAQQADREAIANKLKYNNLASNYLSSVDKTPLGPYLLSQISLILPDNLVITRFQAIRDSNSSYWHITLEGLGPRDLIEAQSALSNLETKLSSPPINMEVKTSWINMWIDNVKFGSTTDREGINKKFYLSGRISL